MIITSARPARTWQGLPEAMLLALLLLALSFARIAGDLNSLAFQNKIIDSVMAGPIWGTAFGRNIAFYASRLLALHVVLALGWWQLGRMSQAAWPKAAISARQWLLVWFVATVGWLLIANATWFPNSSLGAPYAQAIRIEWLGTSPVALATIVLGFAASATAVRALYRLPFRLRLDRRLVAGLAVLGICAAVGVKATFAERMSATPERPHVILIGIDSLRPDAVRPHTQALAAFLDEATTFTDAITPLARTFPSWVSILTGRHPHTTGAVMNLLPRDLVQTGETLPQALSRAGYSTAYAIDEVRFSNIDASYGFDTVVCPPMGASEFLLGRIVDTPLSNVLMNTWVGAFAFPHMHANRAAAVTYDPDTFVRRLDSELTFERPTFLALHLTLAHWPFIWRDAPATSGRPEDARSAEYAHAVRRVDRQFRDVMKMLADKGALENALVVLVSDHGEALGQHSDSSIFRAEDALLVDLTGEIYGHGTSVFSPPQYQVVLGFRSYGSALEPIGGKVVDVPVSLEDVTPTVLELLGSDFSDLHDGRSLVALLREGSGADESFRERIRFMETEFNPQDFFLGREISQSGLVKAAIFYRVDPVSDRIELRREYLSTVLGQRQYAAILGDELIAALPQVTPGEYRFFTLERSEGVPRELQAAPGPEIEPRLARLWQALHERFELAQHAFAGT